MRVVGCGFRYEQRTHSNLGFQPEGRVACTAFYWTSRRFHNAGSSSVSARVGRRRFNPSSGRRQTF